jgi:hypothetical protein
VRLGAWPSYLVALCFYPQLHIFTVRSHGLDPDHLVQDEDYCGRIPSLKLGLLEPAIVKVTKTYLTSTLSLT